MTFYWLFEVLEKLVWATFLKCPQYGLGCKFLTNSWKTIQFQSYGETPEPKFSKYFGYFWTLQRSFYLSLLCAHGCPCKLLWTFFTMPLPQVFYEDPVRLALLCPTVVKLFSKNGDKKVLSIKNKKIKLKPKRKINLHIYASLAYDCIAIGLRHLWCVGLKIIYLQIRSRPILLNKRSLEEGSLHNSTESYFLLLLLLFSQLLFSRLLSVYEL